MNKIVVIRIYKVGVCKTEKCYTLVIEDCRIFVVVYWFHAKFRKQQSVVESKIYTRGLKKNLLSDSCNLNLWPKANWTPFTVIVEFFFVSWRSI